MRKVELGPAKKQQTKGGSANVKKYEALVEAKEQQVLQLQQELTATKTRLKMLESGKGGGAGSGGGKRPAAARRDGRLVRPRTAPLRRLFVLGTAECRVFSCSLL